MDDSYGWKEEVNQWGGVRRYRMVNGVKEYEIEITTSHGTMTPSQLKSWNENKAERDAARLKAEQSRRDKAQRFCCPFSNGMDTSCKGEQCALYNGGCTLSKAKAAKDTEGLRCPIRRAKTPCQTNCALYNGGCTLTNIFKESED